MQGGAVERVLRRVLDQPIELCGPRGGADALRQRRIDLIEQRPLARRHVGADRA